MPAAISSPPSPAATAAQSAVVNGTGPADDGLAGTQEGAGATSFAALFQQLAARQSAAGGEIRSSRSLPADDALTSDAGEAADLFAALLDRLEAMGLIQADLANTRAAAAPEAALAVPVTAPVTVDPAISAVDAMTKAKTATPNYLVQDAGRGPQDMLPTDRSAGLLAPDQHRGASGARGREFAAQLTAAIEGSKELPHSPGGTATAVQQVIAAASPHSPHAPAATPSLPIAQPVGAAGWGEEVGNRIVWMAGRMESRAELVLTPPQMGRVEVSLAITGDQANASFVSANPAVREMLESALPRLREILADAGIQLGQAQVSAENARQSPQHEKNGDNPGSDRGIRPDTGAFQAADNATPVSPGLKIGRGLVDVFA